MAKPGSCGEVSVSVAARLVTRSPSVVTRTTSAVAATPDRRRLWTVTLGCLRDRDYGSGVRDGAPVERSSPSDRSRFSASIRS